MAPQKLDSNGNPAVGVWNGVEVVPYQPFDQALVDNAARGYPGMSTGFVFGRRTLSVQNTLVTLWDGPTPLYAFPTSAQQMKIASESASDSAAGIGVRKVRIHYLDGDYVPHEETVTLNGMAAVNMVATDVFRINRIHAEEVGSNVISVGKISLTNLAGSVTYSLIPAGLTSSRQAVYTVPAGVTGYVSH